MKIFALHKPYRPLQNKLSIMLQNHQPDTKNKEDYLTPFNRLLQLLDSFQTKENASGIFGFLSATAEYDETTREEILRIEYPRLNEFTVVLKQLDKALETKYNRTSKKEARSIAVTLFKKLEQIKQSLEVEAVRKKLHFEFEGWNPYRMIDLNGLKALEALPGTWPNFKIHMADKGHLAEEYYEWLDARFESLNNVVEKFEEGKYTPQFTELKMIMDWYGADGIPKPYKANRSRKDDLKLGMIYEKKWHQFYSVCDSLSQTIKFNNNLVVQYLTYNPKDDTFLWKGRTIPALAQFLVSLETHGYFNFPPEKGGRYYVCRNFLKFFGLPADDKTVKYLSKEMGNTESSYTAMFGPVINRVAKQLSTQEL